MLPLPSQYDNNYSVERKKNFQFGKKYSNFQHSAMKTTKNACCSFWIIYFGVRFRIDIFETCQNHIYSVFLYILTFFLFSYFLCHNTEIAFLKNFLTCTLCKDSRKSTSLFLCFVHFRI